MQGLTINGHKVLGVRMLPGSKSGFFLVSVEKENKREFCVCHYRLGEAEWSGGFYTTDLIKAMDNLGERFASAVGAR